MTEAVIVALITSGLGFLGVIVANLLSNKSLKDDIKDVRKDVESIRRGVLDVQGPQFKAKCKEVLQDSHQITVDEWLALKKEYEIYTGMGGNSDGSELYNLVHEKYSKHLEQ